MSRRLKKTLFGVGTAALVAATVVIPRFASAETPVPECQQPSPAKCVAINNFMDQLADEPAINSVRVRQAIIDGNFRSTEWISKCENVSPGNRLYLFENQDFLRPVLPDSQIFVLGYDEEDCNGGDAIARYSTGNVTVPNDDSRYVWFDFKRAS
jgi:hypothetical protein